MATDEWTRGLHRNTSQRRRGIVVRFLPGAVLAGSMAGFMSWAAPGISSTAVANVRSSPLDAGSLPMPGIELAPLRYELKLFVSMAEGEEVRDVLIRAGAARSAAEEATRLMKSAGRIPAGTDIGIFLGAKTADGARRLEALSLRPRLDLVIELVRDRGDRLRLASRSIPIDATPQRFHGRVGDSLFWSLRAAGVGPETARQYLMAIATRAGPAFVPAPNDRFELVVDHRLAGTGESEVGPILYAALDRSTGPDIRLVRWTIDGQTGLFEPGKAEQQVEGLLRPLSGTVSSPYGVRVHPILRFARFHRGVDFRATWGTPVVAAADGAVVTAGWQGGYGRQVRLAHQGGLETSYSHLSEVATTPGQPVRTGEIIGYVGSSGFSTGPHLHYEVSRHGRPLDPLSVQHRSKAALAPTDVAALDARLKQLQAI